MRSLKVIVCLLLVLCLSVLPFIQRVHAVVTISTVVGVLILTVLAAMGITLVVKNMSKEAFVLDKGDSFMSSKGYAGSFAEWIAGGTDVDVALKTGFLVLAKPVVDRIKEFVSWLVPGAASDTVVDIVSGAIVPRYAAFLTGTINTDNYGYPRLQVSSVILPDRLSSFTDGVVTVQILQTGSFVGNDSYDSRTGQLKGSGYQIGFPSGYSGAFLVLEEPYYYSRGQFTMLPGIYIGAYTSRNNPNNLIEFQYQDTYFLELNDYTIQGQDSDAAAVIGSYDDLSQLQDTTASDGTVNNTFYISTDGQALNPSSDDMADIIGALQQSLDDINSKLDVLPWTAETAETGQIYPDYDDFQLGDLDFSSLGALITTRFPFSIPWDVMRIFNLFVTEPEAPHWEFDLMPSDYFAGIDTEVSIDLGDYPIIGTISRWFCILDVLLGLAYVSKTWIWTA